jgi:hypothetical protein
MDHSQEITEPLLPRQQIEVAEPQLERTASRQSAEFRQNPMCPAGHCPGPVSAILRIAAKINVYVVLKLDMFPLHLSASLADAREELRETVTPR